MPATNKEFALVTACCLWPPSPRRTASIVAAASGIDWTRFLQVVKRQRVPGLAWQGLAQSGVEMPPDIAACLAGAADRAARVSLAHCAEAIRLQRLCDASGRPCAFVKGVALAALAYGNIVIRQAKDIDMIVAPADFVAVNELLIAAGYRASRPVGALSDAQLALWRAHGKEMEWRHRQTGIALELHWRMTDISFLLAESPNLSALYPVELSPTARIMTLPPADLFRYLCVHGASHGWCRLKWLADVHALIVGEPGLIETYRRRSTTDGTERAVGQALLLCADLFELPLPGPMARALRGSWATSMLARIGRASMTRGDAVTEVYDLPFGTTLIAVSHFLLTKSPKLVIGELWCKALNLDDVLDWPLPRALGFLYRVLRGPLWILRRVSNGGASRGK